MRLAVFAFFLAAVDASRVEVHDHDVETDTVSIEADSDTLVTITDGNEMDAHGFFAFFNEVGDNATWSYNYQHCLRGRMTAGELHGAGFRAGSINDPARCADFCMCNGHDGITWSTQNGACFCATNTDGSRTNNRNWVACQMHVHGDSSRRRRTNACR